MDKTALIKMAKDWLRLPKKEQRGLCVFLHDQGCHCQICGQIFPRTQEELTCPCNVYPFEEVVRRGRAWVEKEDENRQISHIQTCIEFGKIGIYQGNYKKKSEKGLV